MATFVLCLANDLKADASMYSDTLLDCQIVANLNGVGDNDTVILYTHGQYYECDHGEYKANNTIKWGNGSVDAATASTRTFNRAGLDPNLNWLTIIVHACFTAGTVERQPKATKNTHTFAGQYCSALSNGGTRLPNLRVIGYQGATKAGSAGYAADQQHLDQMPNKKRRMSTRAVNPNDGERWKVGYTINAAGQVIIVSTGDGVVWRA